MSRIPGSTTRLRAYRLHLCLISSTDLRHSTHDIAELENCALAVDATYYLSQLLDNTPAHEPLLPALSGLTGFEDHINENLGRWEEARIVPFFVFDGQSVTGQDEIARKRALDANKKTDEAWTLYSQSRPDDAVNTFGANPGTLNDPCAGLPC